jgi:uncharacterized LabA/DUF88 family protein
MKYKSDFITNSSSTNFIFSALSNSNLTKIKLTIEVDILKYIEKIITTKEELDEYFEDYVDYLPDYIKRCYDEINNGKTIYILRCSSDNNDPIETFLLDKGIKNIEFPEDFIILKGDGGY